MAVQTRNKPTPREVSEVVENLTRDNRPNSPLVVGLRQQVANAFTLYANDKHYHWQTYGPHFRDLHKLFDKFGNEILDTVDELAERVRMIGQDPPGTLEEMVALASVRKASSRINMRDMIEEARQNALLVIDELRQLVRTAEDHDDPGTVDLCSKIVQIHEKQEWWLRDMLRQDDGLQSSS